MHTVRNIAYLTVFLFAFLACQQNGDEKDESVFSLKGTLSGMEDTTLDFSIMDTTYVLSVTKDSFSIEISLTEMEIGRLQSNNESLVVYASEGNDLFVNWSEDEVLYDGTLAPLHEEVQSIRDNYLDTPALQNLRQLYSMSTDSFTHLIYTLNRNVKNEIDTSTELSDSRKLVIWNDLTDNLGVYAMNYPLYHGRLTQNDTFEVDSGYFEKVKEEFQLENVELSSQGNRPDLLATYVQNQMRMDTPYIESDSIRLQYLFSLVEKSYEKDTIVDIAKRQFILEQLKYVGPGDASEFISNYVSAFENSSHKAGLQERLIKWEKLEAGNQAPDFTAQYPDSTKLMLNELEGKVVYIDVWATWCGPCLQEIPYLEKMYERYNGKEDVAILSVSIDSDYDKWHQKVTEEEMGGIQLWIDNAWESELNEKYMISSIPRFILVDKEGIIVDADAPRPSSEKEIYEMIDAQL